jgi:hypothetical protein
MNISSLLKSFSKYNYTPRYLALHPTTGVKNLGPYAINLNSLRSSFVHEKENVSRAVTTCSKQINSLHALKI